MQSDGNFVKVAIYGLLCGPVLINLDVDEPDEPLIEVTIRRSIND